MLQVECEKDKGQTSNVSTVSLYSATDTSNIHIMPLKVFEVPANKFFLNGNCPIPLLCPCGVPILIMPLANVYFDLCEKKLS